MKSYLLLFCLLLGRFASAQTNISAYEYWFDQDTAHRILTPVTPAQAPLINANLPVQGLTTGLHTLYVRTKDVNRGYSAILSRSFNVPDTSRNYLTGLRFWTDTGNIRTVLLPNKTLAVDTNLLLDYCAEVSGAKRIYFQLMDCKGGYSAVTYRDATTIGGAPQPFAIALHGDTLFAPSYYGLQWYYSNGQPASGPVASFLHPLTPDSSYYAVIRNSCDSVLSSDTLTYRLNHTGLQETSTGESVLMYPNPAKDNLTIEINQRHGEPACITILNALGEVVETQHLTVSKITFPVNLAPGIYTVSIKSTNQNDTRKIVVQ